MYLLVRYLHILCALMLILLWHTFSCFQQVYPSKGIPGHGCVDVSQQQMHPLKWLFQDNLHSCAAGISKKQAVSNLAVCIAFKM